MANVYINIVIYTENNFTNHEFSTNEKILLGFEPDDYEVHVFSSIFLDLEGSPYCPMEVVKNGNHMRLSKPDTGHRKNVQKRLNFDTLRDKRKIVLTE